MKEKAYAVADSKLSGKARVVNVRVERGGGIGGGVGLVWASMRGWAPFAIIKYTQQ